MSLDGTTAVITGAGSGMGRATALLAARQGAFVVCVDVAPLDGTLAELGGLADRAGAVVGDVRDPGAWAAAVDLARERTGRIDLLANIAGIVPPPGTDTVVGQTPETWERFLGVHLTGPWLGMKAIVPVMLEQGGGAIVNVTSLAASRGLPMLAAYSASKAALAGLTRQAAVEYGGHGIRVNAVAPGDIDTPMSSGNAPEVREALRRRTPQGRQGTAEEVAEAIVFLAGPAGSFVNGQVLPVDGGWSIKG